MSISVCWIEPIIFDACLDDDLKPGATILAGSDALLASWEGTDLFGCLTCFRVNKLFRVLASSIRDELNEGNILKART